ncbi:chloride channel protein [Gordonia hankookensis]|uniref:Chloride channel protein n=2 Tax=Gordonia hankookensis TaxID=589403 RepID=A0ABR7WCA7_9ACTN|nr:chloride channel protein [Gordonia hankookensis]
MLLVTAWAIPVGALGAGAAWVLLHLIGLVTNLVFYQRFRFDQISPGAHGHPWWLIVAAPVLGGVVVGLMARFGSAAIRGHGMPEAIEAILTRGSTISPRVAVLKPVSSAVSIGTGGPFGAEGPIIMTGGAIGSILAQHLHITADERKTLLVSGAAAGMAATFNSPVAAVLLAVELLLFEWRPRSFIPVVAAVATATVVRAFILGTDAVFAVPMSQNVFPWTVDLGAVLIGLSGGLLAVAATWLVYRSEDAFARLPVHWMWWPAIGGLVIGIGGLIEPRALGVGYDVIDDLLTGHATMSLIVGILTVKTVIWALSLGSGTSGGVLAPIFMIGAALGALEGNILPHTTAGLWAMLGLAAVLGGVMRSPLTGVIFTVELTHAWSAMLPLLVSATAAYALSVLILKRSVLTEKLARRGQHLTREYSTDPLEAFTVADVARADSDALAQAAAQVGSLPHVYPRQTLREVAYDLADAGATSAIVLGAGGRPIGLLTTADLLTARLHDLTESRHRQRYLPLPRRRVTTPAGEDQLILPAARR